MKIAMIGTGYVGLVTGACLADLGHHVTCVDRDTAKIDFLKNGGIPIYEPGLDTVIDRNEKAGRLAFTTSTQQAVAEAEAVFIAVGTPTRKTDGEADLTAVYAVAEEVGRAIKGYTVVVDKSTVPVGTGDEVERIIREINPSAEFDVVSNPEFLREGSAIEDFMKPDRVVLGVPSERAKAVMQAVYRPFLLNETPVLFFSRTTSELIKYAANAFLATKVTFINEIADICEQVGADVQGVSRGIGLDGRIGSKFLQAGAGFGGSCFPKDSLALVTTARKVGKPTQIVEAVIAANNERKRRMAEKIIDACGGSVHGKKLAVLGVTFKPNTDDMRDAPSLDIVPLLQDAGATIQAFDPEGMKEAAKHLNNVVWCEDVYSTMDDAAALVILTEWNEFRVLDFDRVRALLNHPLIIDLRNIFTIAEMEETGFTYHSVGREPVLLHHSS